MLVTGEIPGLMSGGGLYSEVKGIMDNGHMGISPEQNDRQTLVKALPSCNFVGGQ